MNARCKRKRNTTDQRQKRNSQDAPASSQQPTQLHAENNSQRSYVPTGPRTKTPCRNRNNTCRDATVTSRTDGVAKIKNGKNNYNNDKYNNEKKAPKVSSRREITKAKQAIPQMDWPIMNGTFIILQLCWSPWPRRSWPSRT